MNAKDIPTFQIREYLSSERRKGRSTHEIVQELATREDVFLVSPYDSPAQIQDQTQAAVALVEGKSLNP